MKSPTRFYSEARQRASRRRSPWSAALLLSKWVIAAAWCVALHRFVLWVPHRGALSFRAAAQHDIQMIIISLPLLCLSFVFAMITANYLFYLIPHARRTFESEAGSNPKLKFGSTQKTLLKIAAVMAIVILPMALAVSWTIGPQQSPTYSSKAADSLSGNAQE